MNKSALIAIALFITSLHNISFAMQTDEQEPCCCWGLITWAQQKKETTPLLLVNGRPIDQEKTEKDNTTVAPQKTPYISDAEVCRSLYKCKKQQKRKPIKREQYNKSIQYKNETGKS